MLLDLTYTRLLKDPVDLNTWCIFGPGAQRGLRLIYPNLPMKYALQTAKELWKAQDFKNLREPHVSFLTLQDIEFSLCELFKYMRIKAGGRSKATYDGL